jgi:ceramide glucosyltransferase
MNAYLSFWLLAVAVSALFSCLFVRRLGIPVSLSDTPKVAVIVPVKGDDEEVGHFLRHLFSQEYPNYRVIFAVQAENDPAVRLIEPYRAAAPDRATVTIAGLARQEGQKNTNLRAALKCLTPDDAIVVFADADMRPSKDWLTRLVAPLVDGSADIVSGFSWPFPKDKRPASLVVGSMMAALVAVPRLPALNACWGGSTALSQDLVRKLDLDELWRNSFSDDLALTAAAQKAGCRIAAPREMLQPIHFISAGFGEAIEDAARWSLLFKLYLPAAYVIAVAVLTFFTIGWIVALAGLLTGHASAALFLVAAFALLAIRALARAVMVRRLWGDDAVARNRVYLMWDTFTSPVATALSAFSMWRAAFYNRATWAGITYAIRGPKTVEVIARRDP